MDKEAVFVYSKTASMIICQKIAVFKNLGVRRYLMFFLSYRIIMQDILIVKIPPLLFYTYKKLEFY